MHREKKDPANGPSPSYYLYEWTRLRLSTAWNNCYGNRASALVEQTNVINKRDIFCAAGCQVIDASSDTIGWCLLLFHHIKNGIPVKNSIFLFAQFRYFDWTIEWDHLPSGWYLYAFHSLSLRLWIFGDGIVYNSSSNHKNDVMR